MMKTNEEWQKIVKKSGFKKELEAIGEIFRIIEEGKEQVLFDFYIAD